MRRILAVAWIGTVALFEANCVFVPETGEPITAPEETNTPKAAIDQLLNAYENLRYDNYAGLFPDDNSFRFYVSPTLTEPHTIVNTAEVDSYSHVPSGTYRNWNQETELRGHEKLFRNAKSVRIAPWPVYSEEDFIYRLDEDSNVVVEVLMTGGEMEVTIETSSMVTYVYPVQIERQVFVLSFGEDRWYIKEWFDLGTSG